MLHDAARAREANMLLAATICVPTMSDAECTRYRDLALASGFNILSDDYVRAPSHRHYFLDIVSGRAPYTRVRQRERPGELLATQRDALRRAAGVELEARSQLDGGAAPFAVAEPTGVGVVR
jgi:hypothetical protein